MRPAHPRRIKLADTMGGDIASGCVTGWFSYGRRAPHNRIGGVGMGFGGMQESVVDVFVGLADTQPCSQGIDRAMASSEESRHGNGY
jgi:hypothetical protein